MTKTKNFLLGAVAVLLFVDGTRVLAQSTVNGPAEVSAEEKAQRVIQRARQAISKGVKLEDVKGYIAHWQTRKVLTLNQKESAKRDAQSRQYESTITLEILLPNKMRWREQSDFTSNQSITTEVLNGDQAESQSETIIDGKPISLDLGDKEPPSRTLTRMKSRLNSQVLHTLLTPTLNMSSPFTYVGEAESKDGRADVIGATTASGLTLRLFFDKESGLLVMVSYVNKEGKELQRIFFSDYRVEDKLLVAHRVTVEVDGMVVEEREIKSLKLNPSFSGNEFKVKLNP